MKRRNLKHFSFILNHYIRIALIKSRNSSTVFPHYLNVRVIKPTKFMMTNRKTGDNPMSELTIGIDMRFRRRIMDIGGIAQRISNQCNLIATRSFLRFLKRYNIWLFLL